MSGTECKRNCWDNWVNFNRAKGQMLSAYEHIVPEQLFSTAENPVEAVSAVKAIAVAARQGQRIYTFTQDNRYLIDGLSIDQGTKDEIKAAVQAGKEATVHEAPLDYAGWRGVGYIIVDPTTGAGAYKISGGADGGVLIIAGLMIMFAAFLFLPALLASGIGLAFFGFALTTAANLIAAGFALISGNSFLCSVFLTAALATIGFMMGLLVPPASPVLLHYFVSLLGLGGVGGTMFWGGLCSK